MSTVLIVGTGDMGERLAAGLAAGGRVRRLVLVDRPGTDVADAAATLASAFDCIVEGVEADAARQDEIAAVLARARPDLIVQCASRSGPWALLGRDDAAARAVSAGGLGLRLPYQLPVLLAVMRAARDAGYEGPVANLSLPDLTGPILARVGLAPTVGLGNAGMQLLRARAALRAADHHGELPLVRAAAGRSPAGGCGLIRIVGHHSQVYGVMQAREPADPGDRCRVHRGEDGRRDDGLAYRGPALAPGVRYNHVTAAAALPVLQALLPGGAPLRWSTPAPGGLPGGYPVRIADGAVELDLPPGVDRDEAIAFNARMGRADGVERIDDDGTVHFTEACRAAIAGVDPALTEPLPLSDLERRAALLDAALA